MATRIVLADDHAVVRSGLKLLLESEEDLEVVALAGTAEDALRYVHGHKPDVLVLDLTMPGLSGLEVARQVSQRSPKTHIVMLSGSAAEPHVLEALHHGVAAYVLKGCDIPDLLRAVREASAGRHYFSPPLSDLAI